MPIIHLTIEGHVINSFLIILSVIIGALFTYLFNIRINKKQFQQNKQIAKYSSERIVSQKASVIAELFALWARSDVTQHKDTKARLNHLSYECMLWLPDDIANDVSNLFLNPSSAKKKAKDILIDVRKYLYDKNTKIKANNIIHWM